MRMTHLAAAVVMAAITTHANAVTFGAPDARSLGMGGVGAASADATNAHYYNPALLATKQKTKLFTADAMGTLIVADSDDLFTSGTEFADNDYIGAWLTALDQFQTAIGTGIPANITTAKNNFLVANANLNSGLDSISGKPVTAAGNASAVLAIPNKPYSIAVSTGAWVDGGMVAEYTDADRQTLLDTQTAVSNCDPGTPATCSGVTAIGVPTFSTNFQLRAAFVKETSVTIAKKQTIMGHDLVVGITPKLQMIDTIDKKFAGNATSSFSLSLADGLKSYTGVNVDLGVAKMLGNGLRTGIVVKNLLPMSYDTVLGNTIKIGPAIRTGAAYKSKRLTAGIDLDLLPNDPAGAGSTNQYLAMGAELDLWILKGRAGYRYDIANSANSMSTFGIGFNLFIAHIDAALAVGGQGLSGGAQLGVKW